MGGIGGIDLAGDSITYNDYGDGPSFSPDQDPGPNELQNYPDLTSAFSPNITGTLDSTPNTTFRLQFFSNDTGAREGAVFLTETMVTTDETGRASFSVPADVPFDAWATATATDPAGNTSEFADPKRNNP